MHPAPFVSSAAFRNRPPWTLAFSAAIVGAALGLLTAPAFADSLSFSVFELTQNDQLTVNVDMEHGAASESNSHPTDSGVDGSASTTYQHHKVGMSMEVATHPGLSANVALRGLRNHTWDGSGQTGTSIRWVDWSLAMNGQARFADTLTFKTGSSFLPKLTSAEFVWKLNGTNTQIIDIRPNEKPLYRLEDRVRFKANAGGMEQAPVSVDKTIYENNTLGEPPYPWTILSTNVNLDHAPLPGLGVETMKVIFQQDPLGNYLPVDLSMDLQIDSQHRALNDGPTLNYFIQGFTSFGFSESADLLGVLVRDETGAARTDITIVSANGVDYSLLNAVPEPSTLALLASGAIGLLAHGWWRKRKAA